jgi:hypothetical protein
MGAGAGYGVPRKSLEWKKRYSQEDTLFYN